MIWGHLTRVGSEEMLRTIEQEVELTERLTGRKSLSPRVMQAMASVPRDDFVPDDLRNHAFENRPLPIGDGQTISQPFIVALMTDLLNADPRHTVLDVGTGSGYQAAVLAEVVTRVYSVEIDPFLARLAAERLDRLGYHDVTVRNSDGYQGWSEHAPYDGIVVTAAAPFIPKALIDQLKPGARLVIPVGQPYSHQELMVVEKDEQGLVETRDVLGVAFVPLVKR